jgi:hypothetical protein
MFAGSSTGSTTAKLHGEIGLVPPVEFEDNYYPQNPAPATVDASFRASTEPARDTTSLGG